MWLKIGLVMIGGGVGSAIRYLVAEVFDRLAVLDFPYATLAVNVVGCLLIGILGAFVVSPAEPVGDLSSGEIHNVTQPILREEYRVLLMVGMLGGLTTFSTFGLETFHLLDRRQPLTALAYITVSIVLGLGAVWLSFRITQKLLGH